MENKKYVIIDLEMCKVFDEKIIKENNFKNEIIEIGAVIVDENLKITEKFKRYVSPQFGFLDEFIKELTGIKYVDIKNADSFETVMDEFISWLPSDAIIVSWSENDKIQIEHELLVKNINTEKWEQYFETWEDCQQEFNSKMKAMKSYRLSEALVIADINYDENIHDALVDAQNTALLFVKMKKEKVLKLNKHYSDDTVSKTYTYNPFEEFLLTNKK